MKLFTYAFCVIGVLGSIRPSDGQVPDSKPGQDMTPISLEIKAANDLAFGSWNLTDVKKHYEIALGDLRKFRITHAEWNSDAIDWEVKDLEADLEIVNWEIEGASKGNPEDPHGLVTVTAHLQNHFHEAEMLQVAGNYNLAQQEFNDCLRSWTALQNMHPTWQPAMVWQEIKACYARIPNKVPSQPYRYQDPKLGTPLSV